MRILFISPSHVDYLAATLLHGLRTQSGIEAIDVPRYDVIYSDYPMAQRRLVYGRGFTAFFGCEEEAMCRREQIDQRIARNEFGLIIIASIWSSWTWFAARSHSLRGQKIAVLDGADTPQVYPYAGLWLRHPRRWLLPNVHSNSLYFKREWTADSQFNLWHKLLPRSWRSLLPLAGHLRPLSFSIPEGKVIKALPVKAKDFPRHIVDAEVADHVPSSSTTYAFASEEEYYADLQVSRFGITTKRSGWDCLRHYEIAANGCVPCFRDFEQKPVTCAPHGLVPGVNCLSYGSAEELLGVIRKLRVDQYHSLAEGALQWARSNTTKQRAQQFLAEVTKGFDPALS